MQDIMSSWQRHCLDGTPIYVSTTTSNWFVPDKEGDMTLQDMQKEKGVLPTAQQRYFLSRLPESSTQTYQGRAGMLNLSSIRELWFHVTNRCNMACTHCLFSSSPGDRRELSPENIATHAEAAYRLGCRLFALTGGEPFVHPDIDSIIINLLSHENAHVVVLTNGVSIRRHIECIPSSLLERLHLQISLDGMETNHDRLRGRGAFERLGETLCWLKERSVPYTLSMCVTKQNIMDMTDFVEYAAETGAGNIHFMWYFVRGRGKGEDFIDPDTIFYNLKKAVQKAESLDLRIDNIESLKTRIFAPPGTIHDGSTAGWESMAVGPDNKLYPSAALIGVPELATPLDKGLSDAWKKSPILEKVRHASIVDKLSPMRYILGGGDIDHSYIHGRTFSGNDPYLPLHEKTALWLITRMVPAGNTRQKKPSIRLQMGEILESCGAHGNIALVHSNCLLAAASENSLTSIQEFYKDAVGDANPDILNPVGYDTGIVSHIPPEYRFRGYGCGSPVIDAGISEGETVVDLGCGSGVECFIAARLAGKKGSVTGIDMLVPMLDLAKKAQKQVSANLGYNTLGFRKGYLEDLPMETASADVVLSNCVMNLSVNKRRSYSEIFRILRPGGRLVISDVVCETEPDASIRNDETLRGECIAGALTESHLMGLLEETGFEQIHLIKRFPYRVVRKHSFFSLTYSACKPPAPETVQAMYRGPLPEIRTENNTLMPRGKKVTIDRHQAEALGETVFVFDNNGYVTNIEAENCCSCYTAPEEHSGNGTAASSNSTAAIKHSADCMVCGSSLQYADTEEQQVCTYCGQLFQSAVSCTEGHYVCDACHAEDALDVITHHCLTSKETDMLRLFEQIRNHPAIPVHGPEHHAMVPGIILSTYRNLGGNILDMNISSGISRGKTIAGGSCGFMGICGAATGIGIAFSIMLQANPVKPEQRKTVQQVTAAVLEEIARLEAARCCQRDCWIAIKKAAELSVHLLDIPLMASYTIPCNQQHLNNECFGKACPIISQQQTFA